MREREGKRESEWEGERDGEKEKSMLYSVFVVALVYICVCCIQGCQYFSVKNSSFLGKKKLVFYKSIKMCKGNTVGWYPLLVFFATFVRD